MLYAAGMALRHRRNLRLHAAQLLSTPLFLLSPILGRVINRTVPGLIINGLQDLPVFGMGVQLANLIAAAIALWLWRRDPRAGKPWLVALAVIVVQIVGFQLLGASAAWRSLSTMIGNQPLAALAAFGLGAGIAVM